MRREQLRPHKCEFHRGLQGPELRTSISIEVAPKGLNLALFESIHTSLCRSSWVTGSHL